MEYHIFNHLTTKLIVLFLAILIWFFVKTEDNYRYSFKIPLRVTNLGPDRIINNELPKRIKITSWGKGRELLSLMLRKEMFYNLDISRLQHSTRFALEKDDVKLTHESNIEILNIVDPDTIEVKIADLITKKVPIISEAEIQTLPGYTVVDEMRLKPDSVEIIGPKPVVAKISAVRTQHKIFNDVKRDLHKKIRLEKPGEKQVKLLTDESELFANIQKLMEKPIYEVPVTVINQPAGLKVAVIPSALSLVLEGGTDLLLNVTKQDVKAYIDYHKVQASKNKNHLAYIETPRGVRYRDVKPKRFKVVVEKIK